METNCSSDDATVPPGVTKQATPRGTINEFLNGGAAEGTLSGKRRSLRCATHR